MDKSNKNLLSVIIPVYNAEKYIEDCLESIIKQTYKNLEIILVDDGSTDNSYKLCENYMSKDNRIKVFHKENGGVSSARNLGIDNASGEYITFVDIDDSLSADMYEKMMTKLISEKADICVCNYQEVLKNKKVLSKHDYSFGCFEKEEVLRGYLNDKFSPYVWDKIYKLNIVKENKFNSHVLVCEDALFNLNICFYAKKIVAIDEYLYMYNKTNFQSLTKTLSRKFDYFKKMVEYVDEHKINTLK